jgi:hypothetical protein
MNEEDALKPLELVSNVIELKPDKKYVLIFKNAAVDQLGYINDVLRKHGLDCVCLRTFDDVQIIEAPAKTREDRFWEQMSQAMTINERRVIFAKLAEHLGIDIDEQGNTDDGIKKRYGPDEAKEILEPYKEIEDYLA